MIRAGFFHFYLNARYSVTARKKYTCSFRRFEANLYIAVVIRSFLQDWSSNYTAVCLLILCRMALLILSRMTLLSSEILILCRFEVNC
uniref:Uncharacterized protein n=1 Tax=Lotus japonicus TaxID=34305 RepID=I3SAT6_LOTJA|nr:unknown [Lotus japonicus]